MIPSKPHIHYVDDGRPPRRVYVNGEKVGKPIYADTERGIVTEYWDADKPLNLYLLRVKGRCRTRTLSGKVRVETIPRGE